MQIQSALGYSGFSGFSGLGAAFALPLKTTRPAYIYSKASGTANTGKTLAAGTRFTASVISNGFAQMNLGWINLIDTEQDPGQIPGEGITQLQQALTDLAALGYPTDPGGVTGVINAKTVSAVANSLSVVAGDIKGGTTTTTVLQLALNLALINHSVDSQASSAIKSAAKPLAIGIQVFIARKRGQNVSSGLLPESTIGGISTQTLLYAAGGIAALGAVYMLFIKK